MRDGYVLTTSELYDLSAFPHERSVRSDWVGAHARAGLLLESD